jgi:hypothetical protein
MAAEPDAALALVTLRIVRRVYGGECLCLLCIFMVKAEPWIQESPNKRGKKDKEAVSLMLRFSADPNSF